MRKAAPIQENRAEPAFGGRDWALAELEALGLPYRDLAHRGRPAGEALFLVLSSRRDEQEPDRIFGLSLGCAGEGCPLVLTVRCRPRRPVAPSVAASLADALNQTRAEALARWDPVWEAFEVLRELLDETLGLAGALLEAAEAFEVGG